MPRPAGACPAAWRAAWARLARRAAMPVLCPRWLPAPLQPELGGHFNTERAVSHGRWQVGFVDVDPGFSGLVHVVLEGFGKGAWPPTCEDTVRRKGRIVAVPRPCFSAPGGRERIAGHRVTWYLRNRATETGHVAAVFARGPDTFVVGMHVFAPLDVRTTKDRVRRILRAVVLLRP